jgi:hypothetical protein
MSKERDRSGLREHGSLMLVKTIGIQPGHGIVLCVWQERNLVDLLDTTWSQEL